MELKKSTEDFQLVAVAFNCYATSTLGQNWRRRWQWELWRLPGPGWKWKRSSVQGAGRPLSEPGPISRERG